MVLSSSGSSPSQTMAGLSPREREMPVDAIGADVQSSVVEPPDVQIVGRVGNVLDLGVGSDPVDPLAVLGPEGLGVRDRSLVTCSGRSRCRTAFRASIPRKPDRGLVPTWLGRLPGGRAPRRGEIPARRGRSFRRSGRIIDSFRAAPQDGVGQGGGSDPVRTDNGYVKGVIGTLPLFSPLLVGRHVANQGGDWTAGRATAKDKSAGEAATPCSCIS